MPLANVAAHDGVLGRADGGEIERDLGAFQPALRLGMKVAVAQFDRRAHRLERGDMQVHGPRADGAAARQAHFGAVVTRQKRPQHEVRGPHLAHDVVMRDVVVRFVGRHGDDLAVIQRRHLGPQRLQQFGHGADVREARRIGQRQRLIRQKRRGHQRQAGVLGPRDGNRARKLRPALNDYSIQPATCLFLIADPGKDQPSLLSSSCAARARACALRLPILALSAAFNRSSRVWAGFAGLVVRPC